MSKDTAAKYALIAAGIVIVALTALAFWLSYAHLADVAGQHGLARAPERKWAWPATLDAFVVAGELLMLRAGLRGRTDWYAVGLTAAGSVGSIALNVAGVAGTRDTAPIPALDYVVAAVPPTAALLAFGVLMRQIHELVTEAAPVVSPVRDTPVPAAVPEVSLTPEPAAPAVVSAPANPLVICGVHLDVPPVPALPKPLPAELPTTVTLDRVVLPAPRPMICTGHLDVPPVPPRPRLDTEAARAAIEQAWLDGRSIRDAAKLATRAPSQVQRVYAELQADRDARPTGQLELEGAAA